MTQVVVCNPRKNALLKTGNKSDRIDARKLAELLRGGLLAAVYHGENGLRTLKELCRGYLAISKDLARTMNRVKALYILSDAAGWTLVGAVAGLIGSWAAGRSLRSLLFEVSPNDPSVTLWALVVLTSVGLVAAWLPGRRASKLDPMVAFAARVVCDIRDLFRGRFT